MLLGVFLLILIIINQFVPNIFTSTVQTIARPFIYSRLASVTGIGNFFLTLKSNYSLANEISSLKAELALLEAVKTERDQYKVESEALRELMGRSPKDVVTLVATILSKPGFSPYDTVVADAGNQENVQPGKKVFADDSIIVGRVSTVHPYTSTIILYSSAGQETSVLIGTTSIQSIAEGKGGGNFEVKLPRNSGVTVGDRVMLADNPQWIIGTVGLVDVAPSDSSEKILFRSPVNVNKLKYLFIEK